MTDRATQHALQASGRTDPRLRDRRASAPSSTPAPTPPDNPLSRQRALRLAERLLDWYAKNARDLPWRRTRDPYAIWVAEVMLQQTQVATVVPYWTRWMSALPTIEALAAADPNELLRHWAGLGYYRRLHQLHLAARLLRDRGHSQLPSDAEALRQLPGIGPYTAGAISSIAFNQPAPIVDGNVVRVLSRLLGVATPVRDKANRSRFWVTAGALVSAAARLESTHAHRHACGRLNQALMELGATVCRPQTPDCLVCPWQSFCKAGSNDTWKTVPNLGQRQAPTHRKSTALVIRRQARVLVLREPARDGHGSWWVFPRREGSSPPDTTAALPNSSLRSDRPRRRLGVIRHSITRYRLEVQVIEAQLRPRNRIPSEHRWARSADLAQLPMRSLDRKIAMLAASTLL